jgi:hypothetical protein
MIAFGASDMTKAYVGSTEVSKVYLGSDLVWGGDSPALPYDARVEYLQSSGTQYIDTEIVLTKNYSISIDLAFVEGNGGISVGLGALNGTTQFSTPIAINSNGHPFTQVGGSSSYVYLYTSSKIGTTLVHYTCTGNGSTQYLSDGNKTVSKAFSGSLSTLSMFLFARHRTDTVAGNYAKAKIGAVSITVGGSLVRDYIPVRVGTTGYMYDRVSGNLFGNSGTGSFVLGNDVTI